MISNYSKSRLLIGASTAFIATLSGTMAVAQVTASVLTDAASPITSTVVGSIVSGDGAAQLNNGAIVAGVTSSTITTTVTGASTGTFTNSSNTADALAQGNRNGVTVSLATISATASVSDGIAIATVSSNTGAITATAINQDAGATLTGFTAGSVAVASNSIDATTVINDGTGIYAVAVNNAVPVGYSDLATAAATAVIGNAVGTDSTINAGGTLVAANTQVTLGANSNATAGSSTSGDENTILLSLLSTAANSVTGSAVLDSNNVGASFAGNARTTSIGIASDNASFAGTAVIANSQSFDGNTTTGDNALNQNSRIAATVTSASLTTAATANVFSASSLSVNTNQITSAASGNVATGSISLANGLSYDGGDVGANSSLASIEGLLADGTAPAVSARAISVTGDLILASRQTNTDSAAAFLKATTDDAVISASVQETVGSATTLSLNRVTSAATGNRLDNGVASGAGSALFDASVTLANLQTNGTAVDSVTPAPAIAFAIGATVSDTALTVTLGDTDNGTVVGSSAAMAGNIVASSAIGSQSDQTVALAAATITTAPGYATVLFDQSAAVTAEAGVETSGAVTIASRQINESAAVSADSLRTAITLTSNDDDGVTANNALSVTGNIQQAFAMGGDAGNSLSLAGVSVGAAAGIANSQENASASTVTATLTGTATLAVTESAGGSIPSAITIVTAPSLTVSGNRSEALATGVTAANALSVTATTVDLTAVAAAGGVQSLDTALDTGSISASYAALNEQLVSAAVTASATPLAASAAFALTVGDDTYGATVINDANRLTAQAQAAVAANNIGLNIGTITLTGATEANNVAALLNVQEVAAAVTATAAPNGNSAVVLTRLGNTAATDDLTNASVSTSTNRITAIANGAVASNSLSAAGTSLQVFDGEGGDAGLATVTTEGLLSAAAAFTIINRQEFSTIGPVTATLRQTLASAVTDSALVLTDVAGIVASSNIASNGNMLTALASSLEADNGLMLAGTAVRTTGALVNSQSSKAGVNALIGYVGTDSSAPTSPATITTGTGTSGAGLAIGRITSAGTNYTNTGASLVLTLTNNVGSVAERDFLLARGFTGVTVGSNQITFPAAGVVDLAGFAGSAIITDLDTATFQFNGFTIPGTSASSGTPNAGGVIIAIGNNITGSSVSVASNTVTGQALGNTASNSLSVSATGLDADGASSVPTTAGLLESGIYGADDDFALASDQSVVSNSASKAEVFATFAIDQVADKDITNATLSVDGNAQVAEAMANTVTNTLSVSATDMDVTAATSASLANRQGGTANVDASSDMEVFANVQSNASTITLDGNSNRATGVINNAANSLTVSGTNIAGTGALATVTIVTDDTKASGSFALNNSQTTLATSDLDTTATTNIYNNDLVDTASSGIVNGSVSMANNLTFAESSANRATNSVSVAGGASNAAPAALANDQSSAATVTATAISTIGTTLFGTDAESDLAAASGSSVSVAGNTTQALARGNTATNTMVFTAGADFGTNAGANVNTGAGIATAAAAVLNRQENTAAVIASATATYNVVLNGGAGAATTGVTNGAVSVSGNTVAAAAFGNQATNRIELAVLNSGNATAAFNNRQFNSGPITATASSVTFASSVTGIVTNGAFRNVGNAASATAVGNSSITSIIGR